MRRRGDESRKTIASFDGLGKGESSPNCSSLSFLTMNNGIWRMARGAEIKTKEKWMLGGKLGGAVNLLFSRSNSLVFRWLSSSSNSFRRSSSDKWERMEKTESYLAFFALLSSVSSSPRASLRSKGDSPWGRERERSHSQLRRDCGREIANGSDPAFKAVQGLCCHKSDSERPHHTAILELRVGGGGVDWLPTDTRSFIISSTSALAKEQPALRSHLEWNTRPFLIFQVWIKPVMEGKLNQLTELLVWSSFLPFFLLFRVIFPLSFLLQQLRSIADVRDVHTPLNSLSPSHSSRLSSFAFSNVQKDLESRVDPSIKIQQQYLSLKAKHDHPVPLFSFVSFLTSQSSPLFLLRENDQNQQELKKRTQQYELTMETILLVDQVTPDSLPLLSVPFSPPHPLD